MREPLDSVPEENRDTLLTPHLSRKRRTGGRSQRVQSAVFAAAVELLVREGYDGFAIADVAERAGVNQTSIYRRWGTKEVLITEVLLRQAEERLPIPDTGTLRSDLVAFLASLANFLQSPFGKALLQISALTLGRPELSSYRIAYWISRVSLVNAIFERAIARVEIPASLDTTLTLELLAGPIYVRTLFTGGSVDEGIIKKIVDVVIDGMTSRSASQ